MQFDDDDVDLINKDVVSEDAESVETLLQARRTKLVELTACHLDCTCRFHHSAHQLRIEMWRR